MNLERPRPYLWAFALTLSVTLIASEAAAEQAEPEDAPEPAEQAETGEDAEEALPEAAARRWPLVEPLGEAPAPWAALSAGLDMGIAANAESGWSAVHVRVPVARHYGSVDARIIADFDQEEGFASLSPEFTLRGMPLRLADGRGVLGFSFTLIPVLVGQYPLLTLGGGLMGGYLGQRWFAWAHLGVQAEVLLKGRPQLQSTVAFGLRLPYGLRPQVELDLSWETHPQGELTLAVRPGLRYWPAEFIGVGLSAGIWALGPSVGSTSISLDVIFHARE